MMHILLLRGVNVGGNKKLPMKDLAALLEKLGCAQVRTFIQSGNAVFEAPAGKPEALAAAIRAAIQKKFGFDSPVILRTAAQLKAALKAHPYADSGTDPKFLNIGFLEAKPKAAALAALDPPLLKGEAYKVVGQEIHLLYAHGVGKTKLTNALIDGRLKTVCTVRNLNTCRALLALAEGREPGG